jgi:hypothetical protein
LQGEDFPPVVRHVAQTQQSARSHVRADVLADRQTVLVSPNASSLPRETHVRQYPRQEPYEVLSDDGFVWGLLGNPHSPVTLGENMDTNEFDRYMKERVDDQFSYFDTNAIKNQKSYRRLKITAISCNVLTTMTIALAFTVPEQYKVWMGILALVLSTIVLATYQFEEFQNYGAKWEKFRLVAEQLKSEKYKFLNRTGPYSDHDDSNNRKQFVETVESIIRGTDIAYFSLMVEPGKRIEKRLEQHKEGK